MVVMVSSVSFVAAYVIRPDPVGTIPRLAAAVYVLEEMVLFVVRRCFS